MSVTARRQAPFGALLPKCSEAPSDTSGRTCRETLDDTATPARCEPREVWTCEQAAPVFRALGNTTRRRIIELVNDHPHALCVTEIAAMLGISRQSASRHVAILSSAGIMWCCSTYGPIVAYRTADAPLVSARDYIQMSLRSAVDRHLDEKMAADPASALLALMGA